MSNALPQLVADRYRLISPLGQGGMGRVWKARDEVLHRDVAIKELVPPPSLTPEERREMRERSLREARAIARLNNINVVRIFDVLRTDGDPWIVMEYVPSKSLQDTLAEDGPVSSAKAIQIGLGVLGALKAAHKAGVMHRDVKPGNVLLGDDGRVVLTDFGLATIPGDPNVTRTGMVLGSPAYIAPERAKDGTAGPEADLWSLGATLYAAVEGKSPYARPSAIATLAALATEPLPPPKNAGPLKPVLQGLLRKDPADRITAEVAERLLRKAGGKRAKGISLLDGVRRPGPNGPREPRPPLVPTPRPAAARTDPPVATPAPRKPDLGTAAAAGAAALAADAAALAADAAAPTGSDAAPTAKVGPPVSTADAEPTAKVDAPAPALDETQVDGPPPITGGTRVDAPAPAAVDDDTRVEPPVPPVADDDTRVDAPTPRGPANPTSVMPAPVSPVPSTGRATVVPGTKPDHKRRNLLIGVLVALLLIALVVAVPLLNKGDDPQDGGGQQAGGSAAASDEPSAAATSEPAAPAPSSAGPSVTPSASASSGTALPAGWTLHKDQSGFAVPVPPGFRLDYRRHFGSGPEDWRVRFSDGKGRSLLIDQTTKPLKDAEADWRDQERSRRGSYSGYQLVKIESVDYWDEAADWEWIYNENGRRTHVRNRGFVTAPDKGYAIRWDCPEADWAKNEPNFKIIADGFVPVRK
ncbi:protein kinase [Micromonospora sp. 4G57]|uniref:non-specific serine/threonine protein kinase n=1 Tax=Micromonospora sicca TaxID=2202420 RepID=A0ABU5J9L6_9ACTN|nr:MULTISPECIES: protein kinase [unclassified Micromonospora]MDZ5441953.1 protein kinase [Micromonospora sp. 4G57]MDZ5489194.1 protein kinase [Micromonospora sp. 4G53]